MLTWILAVAAFLCLGYFIGIVFYSGIGTSFAFIWVVMAAFLLLLGGAERYYRKFPNRIPLWVPVSFMTVCVTGMIVFVAVEILVFSGIAGTAQPDLDYVIVLGAKVKEEGSVSRSLQKRLDKAVEYARENPDTVLILSGGQGAGEPVSEADAMYDYMVDHGVPKEQLLKEVLSTSTLENIAYSCVEIDKNQEKRRQAVKTHGPRISGPVLEAPDKPLQIGLLTSNFHVYRAKAIAKKWGLKEVHGIASESDPVLFVHMCVRECAAILKDRLVGNM